MSNVIMTDKDNKQKLKKRVFIVECLILIINTLYRELPSIWNVKSKKIHDHDKKMLVMKHCCLNMLMKRDVSIDKQRRCKEQNIAQFVILCDIIDHLYSKRLLILLHNKMICTILL